MMWINPVCDICQERIESGEDSVKIDVGEARSKNWRWLFGFFRTNPSRSFGRSLAHVDCLEIEHNPDEPAKTAYNLAQGLNDTTEV